MDYVQLIWATDREGTLSAEWGGLRATVTRILPGFDARFVVVPLGDHSIALTSGTLLSTHAAMLAAGNAMARMARPKHASAHERTTRDRQGDAPLQQQHDAAQEQGCETDEAPARSARLR